MKTKLTHRFYVKALMVGLFTVVMLFTAALLSALVIVTTFHGYEYGSFVPWVAATALWLEGKESALYLLMFLSLTADIVLFVFLMCAAGRREGHEEPVLSKLDRIPFDLLLALSAGGYGILFLLVRFLAELGDFERVFLIPLGILLACAILLSLMLCMTFASRVKSGTLIKNNIITAVLLLLWKCARLVGRGLYKVYQNIGILWKAIVIYVVLVVLYTDIVVKWAIAGFGVILAVTAGLAAVCVVMLQLHRLQKAAQTFAAGHLEERVDTKRLLPSLRVHAEYLNGIAAGMNRAVEERMKSERMKTDLITNVSHDLKTPLTSIVNYIDLLRKEPMESENAKQYLEVLARQTQKLKKLTEDVVEASKASSGALTVTLEPTDAGELLHQSLAEYVEKFSSAGLMPQVRVQEGLPRILADGRLLWRVLDNLLSNALKYSLPSTRVYCEAIESGGAVLITVKNISKEPLDTPLDEFMERFVRGDVSRASEGSGLGLSIAKSLTELQKGSLRLTADGDLFKAELRFPVV